jgi:hypothetical protein
MKKVFFAAAVLAAAQLLAGAGIFASAKNVNNVNGRTATIDKQIEAATK